MPLPLPLPLNWPLFWIGGPPAAFATAFPLPLPNGRAPELLPINNDAAVATCCGGGAAGAAPFFPEAAGAAPLPEVAAGLHTSESELSSISTFVTIAGEQQIKVR